MTSLTDPMELAIAADGTVYVIERGGAILQWDPVTRKQARIGYIPVYMIVEDGLLGLALDPDFLENGWMYVFYGPADGGDSRLSRFTVVDDRVDPDSEKILLHVPMQREACCHAAGSLAFGPAGTLYLAVGDNTDHIDTAGGPIDERPGHAIADAQLTSSNTNDLRGKILRIKPALDGTYTIPEGNLFAGDADHRPEIYAMGLRNPFRIAVDTETGWLYFADVGNGDPPNERGDWGWDEFNQARGPGNFGWPYITGDNQPYRDFDYETGEVGAPFDPLALVNDSPNNTGVANLPPALPAMIWYTFGESEEFPEMGTGGVNPMSGPVYRRAHTHTPTALPDYYIGKHFIYDWMRNWVQVVSFDEMGDLQGIEPFLPEMTFARPMDMEVGPDGALYVIEWGNGFWGSNADAQVVRVVYKGTDYPRPEMEEIDQGLQYDISLAAPAPGSFFAYDTPIHYRIEDEGRGTLTDEAVRVKVYAGYDTNRFLVDEQLGNSGTFRVSSAYTHVPDLHYVDRFAVVQVCYDAPDRSGKCNEYKLHPREKEAAHTYHAINASRRTYGVQPAAAEFHETALTVMRLRNGSEVWYGPFAASAFDQVRVRYKTMGPAVLHVVTGIDTTTVDLRRGQRLDELPQAGVLDRLQAEGKGHVIERLQRSAYQGWREIVVPVTPATGPDGQVIKLVVSSEEGGVVVELDHLVLEAANTSN